MAWPLLAYSIALQLTFEDGGYSDVIKEEVEGRLPIETHEGC